MIPTGQQVLVLERMVDGEQLRVTDELKPRRFLSTGQPGCAMPPVAKVTVDALLKAGWIEPRAPFKPQVGTTYLLTDSGRQAAAGAP